MMDVRIDNGDIALKGNGDFEYIDGMDEAVQRVRMTALTNRGEFIYDRSFGVDYDAFSPNGENPVGKLDMLIREGIAGIGGVDAQVLSYDAQTRTVGIRVTFRGRTAVTEVDISGII